MEKTTTLQGIMADFSETELEPEEGGSVKSGAPITIWLPREAKESYDRLQKNSGRRFSKKARQAVLALIAIAERRVG